jgi:hypothetical protein
VGDMEFLVIFVTDNPFYLFKTKFWKEKSIENVVTLEGLPFNSSMISSNYIISFKHDKTNYLLS